jgi:hypothetical protein
VGSFALDLSRFGDKVNGNATRVVRKVALELLRGVVMATPVDTGRARANWQTTIGEMALGTVDAPSSAGSAAAEAIADGAETIQLGAHLGDDVAIFLTNNLPYIDRLEHGWSKQAPDGMVAKTIARFPFLVDQATQFADGGGI